MVSKKQSKVKEYNGCAVTLATSCSCSSCSRPPPLRDRVARLSPHPNATLVRCPRSPTSPHVVGSSPVVPLAYTPPYHWLIPAHQPPPHPFPRRLGLLHSACVASPSFYHFEVVLCTLVNFSLGSLPLNVQ